MTYEIHPSHNQNHSRSATHRRVIHCNNCEYTLQLGSAKSMMGTAPCENNSNKLTIIMPRSNK